MSSKECVLIIDDQHSLVWFIGRILQRDGFDVLTAFNGWEGLQRAREAKPDLIILDTVMPKMNGYRVYHDLQKDPDTAPIPVLFLTIKSIAEEKKILTSGDYKSTTGLKNQAGDLLEGIFDFLTKPVTAKEVVDRVQALLQLSRLRARGKEERRPKSRILIVDDNQSVVLLAERVLQKEGYTVITAFDGLDGLRKMREEKPDLIILDIIMPKLNGFQVLDLVRQHTSVPVIMLTSDNEVASVKLTLALGADDYVVKPFSARDLLARVREKLGRTSAGIL